MSLPQEHIPGSCSAWEPPRPSVLLGKPAFQLGGTHHIFVHGAALPQEGAGLVPLIELHEVPLSSFLQPVEISLDAAQHFCDI